MSSIPDTLSGASQLAVRLADRSGPGFSKAPGDCKPARIQRRRRAPCRSSDTAIAAE